MVSTRRKREQPQPQQEQQEEEDTENEKEEEEEDYEQIREKRIRENKERMNKLGLLALSRDLNLHSHSHKPVYTKKTSQPKQPLSPQRRSSRLSTLEPVKYSEFFVQRGKRESSSKETVQRGKRESSRKETKEVEIDIPEGTKPEVYTEEHEKLLGDSETAWELYVDGYDEDGERLDDPIRGEKCHQCRQTTLCEHTSCNKCELPQGQLCGDCLYTRYGENVMEANVNTKWTCPACRGICNCFRCRKANGWMPTGNIYRKVLKKGFKSVAHYLIQTYRSAKVLEDSDTENIVEKGSEASADSTVNRRRSKRILRS